MGWLRKKENGCCELPWDEIEQSKDKDRWQCDTCGSVWRVDFKYAHDTRGGWHVIDRMFVREQS